MNWSKFEGKVKSKITGVKVPGNNTIPESYLRNIWFMIRYPRRTKTFQVLRSDATHGYVIGFILRNGEVKIGNLICHNPAFAMKIWYESYTVFAVKWDDATKEIQLSPEDGLLPLEDLDPNIPCY